MAGRVRAMMYKLAATPEQLRARLELRRSSVARPHKSKKDYNRKDTSWKREY